LLGNVLASWLTSLRERGEFEVCFRSLLRAQGYVPVGTRTTHGPIEYGKDVVAWHPQEEILYLFQLKAGDVKRSDWPDLDRQLYELAAVPYDHPNYVVDAPRKAVLVCTGQVDATVQDLIAKQKHAGRGLGAVVVWDRETLVKAYSDDLFSVQVLSEAVAIDHIRVWSHVADYGADEDDLWSFFTDYIGLLEGAGGRARHRILSGYVVAVAQLAQRYLSTGSSYSAIDCAILGAVVFYGALLRHCLSRKVAAVYCMTLRELLTGLLQGLADACESDQTALSDLSDTRAGLEEMFLLPLRVHSLTSKLSLLAFMKEQADETDRNTVGLVDSIVRRHPSFSHVVSERQAGSLVVTLLALLRHGFPDTARDAVVRALNWVAGHHGYPGAPGLPDPYRPIADIPSHFLRPRSRSSGPAESRPGDSSYLLPILVKFASLRGQRGVVEKNWPLISRTTATEYIPRDETEMYSRRSTQGELRDRIYPRTQSWRVLRRQCSRATPTKYLSLAKAYPETLLLLALAYPWRAALCEPSFYLPTRGKRE